MSLYLFASWLALVGTAAAGDSVIVTHDNTRAAGALRNGTLTLRLYAGSGPWLAEAANGAAVIVQAFGEESRPLQIPAPLIRVPQGTTIEVSIRNTLAVPLDVHGFGSRPMATGRTLRVEAGRTEWMTFAAGAAGTYHYWATTTHAALRQRFTIDSQLSGAFIVDEGFAAPSDQIFVLTSWFVRTPRDGGGTDPADPRHTYLVNGRAWPHTTRVTYDLGEIARWHVINGSGEDHPMHLHGFFFKIEVMSDGLASTFVPRDHQRQVVTDVVSPGGTIRMSWVAERPGNWLFHCHIVGHMSPALTVAVVPPEHHHADHGAAAGMSGLVLGITVRGNVSGERPSRPAVEPRRITLMMEPLPKRFGDDTGFGFAIDGTDAARTPGPLLVLKRSEPVEITLVNNLPEPAAIHWHGIELESFFDGVPDFSGSAGSTTPAIRPGGHFEVRFTPPRTGTFIYPTHSHDETALAKGLYGALLVLDPSESYDPATDHVLILGLNGASRVDTNADDQILLNGTLNPTITLKAHTRNRLRLINITANNSLLNVLLLKTVDVAMWRALPKDGADLPEAERAEQPARQLVSIGEVYDFEYVPDETPHWLEVKRGNGRLLIQAPVVAR